MSRTEKILTALFLAAATFATTPLPATPLPPEGSPAPAKKAGKKSGAAPAATPAPTPAAAKTPRPPIYDPYVSGERAIMDTAKLCAAGGKRLFVSFGTNDCELCHVAHEAFSNPEFREVFFKAFIPVYIDVTPGTDNAKFLESYGINRTKGLPAMAVFEFSPEKVTISQNGEYADAAKLGPDAVRFFLSQFLPSEVPPTPTPGK